MKLDGEAATGGVPESLFKKSFFLTTLCKRETLTPVSSCELGKFLGTPSFIEDISAIAFLDETHNFQELLQFSTLQQHIISVSQQIRSCSLERSFFNYHANVHSQILYLSFFSFLYVSVFFNLSFLSRLDWTGMLYFVLTKSQKKKKNE